MATGPNFIALSDIKNRAVEEEQINYDESTTNNLQQLERILQNNREFEAVMKNLRKQFDYLGSTNTHITQFYPQFITENTYVQDSQKTVIYDQSMSELLFKLEKENQQLKVELKSWMQQFGKKAYLTQLLVKQNKTLQEQIILQDKDLIKIIDSLSGKQSQQLKDLEDKMTQLKVENGVLIQHLSDIQQQIMTKKQYQSQQNINLEQYQKNLNQTKQKLTQTCEQQDHETKMYAMLKTIVDNLAINLAQLDQQQTHLSNENRQLETDKHDLSYHLNSHKTQIGDMKTNIVNQNNDKTNQQKLLTRQKISMDEQLKYTMQKVKKLQSQIAREDRMIQHYSKASGEVDIKVKNCTQHLKSIEANLGKQLDKQTEKGSQIMLTKYEIELLEQQIQLIKNHKRQQQAQFPNKAKQINEEFQTQKKQLDKQLQQIDIQQTRTLMNLNNEVIKYKAELDRAQRQLQQKNEDLKDAKNEQIEIKRLKGVVRQLGGILRQKVAQTHA